MHPDKVEEIVEDIEKKGMKQPSGGAGEGEGWPTCTERGREGKGQASTSSAPFGGTFPCQGKACRTVGFPPGGKLPPDGG